MPTVMELLRVILLALIIAVCATPASASFTYDANGRLLTATGPWGTNGAQAAGSYVYDALGNLRSWTQGAKTGTVGYGDATNRVTTYAKTGDATRNFTYDSRGNVAGNGDNSFTYDFANQPVSVGGAIPATHAYDGNFKRVKTVENGKTIYQVFSRVTGGLVYRDEATDGETTDYASVGGAALRLKKIGTGPLVPEYTHFDLQGSAVAATDAAGAVLWRESYRPYGRSRLDPPANDNNTGYTGHLADKSTGLVYMQARYYDPLIGRFLSTDPVGYQDQLNLYAYVANDPVNKIDPDGEVAFLVTGGVGAIIGGVVGGGLEAYKQARAGKGFNAGKIGLQAGKGALVGLAVGLTGGAAGAVVELAGATGAGAAATVALPSAAVGATGTALVSVTNDIDAGLPASEVSDNSVKAFATGGAGALAGGAASPTIGNAIKNMSGFGGVGNVNGAGAVVGEVGANIVSTVVTESANTLPELDIKEEN